MLLGKIRNQRGAGTFGCMFLMALVATAMYAGFQMGIPRIRHRSFEDRINESLTNLRQMQPEEAQRQLIALAADFDIALTPDQVKVTNVNRRLRIEITYQKLVDLKVWQDTITFKAVREPAP